MSLPYFASSKVTFMGDLHVDDFEQGAKSVRLFPPPSKIALMNCVDTADQLIYVYFML